MAGKFWSACVPGVTPGEMVRVELQDGGLDAGRRRSDGAAYDAPSATVELTWPHGEGESMRRRVVLPVRELRALLAVLVEWPLEGDRG